MVSFLEAMDLRADRSNGSRAVRTKHIREGRFGAEQLREFAFAFVGVPDTHAGGFDAKQDFIGPEFGHRQLLHVNIFDATESVKSGGTHG